MNRAQAIEAMERLYSQLPNLECKGLCHDTCVTGISHTELEADRIEAATGVRLPPPLRPEALKRMTESGRGGRCPLLSPVNTCRGYAVRPLVCRAFGMVGAPDPSGRPWSHQALMCDHGCVPDGTITNEMYWAIQLDLELDSRHVTGRRRILPDVADGPLRRKRDELLELLDDYYASGDRSGT